MKPQLEVVCVFGAGRGETQQQVYKRAWEHVNAQLSGDVATVSDRQGVEVAET